MRINNHIYMYIHIDIDVDKDIDINDINTYCTTMHTQVPGDVCSTVALRVPLARPAGRGRTPDLRMSSFYRVHQLGRPTEGLSRHLLRHPSGPVVLP